MRLKLLALTLAFALMLGAASCKGKEAAQPPTPAPQVKVEAKDEKAKGSKSKSKDKPIAELTDEELIKRAESLKKKLAALEPRGSHIVVDTSRNALILRKDSANVREALISSGSGNVLTSGDGKKQWVFDTPRGEFTIKSKVRDPIWIKPDWAFIEEGEKIPRKGADRSEPYVLGEYAMGFGDGFFIHGTLYTRLLGYNVTHGCIRMGDEDLKAVFKEAVIGTKLYIF